jgi:hypothetical protein
MCLITIAHNAGKLPEPFARTDEHGDAPNVVNCEHSGKHWMMDHRGRLGKKDMFFTRPPPDPHFCGTAIGMFLDSIRDQNAFVVRRKPGESDELYRSEKTL